MSTSQQVLDCIVTAGSTQGITIRQYLHKLLSTVWREQDEFSGKRPFGDSGWDYDLYQSLITADLLEGVLDEDGYLESVDDDAGHALIQSAIDELLS